jgi:hypothetical protein
MEPRRRSVGRRRHLARSTLRRRRGGALWHSFYHSLERGTRYFRDRGWRIRAPTCHRAGRAARRNGTERGRMSEPRSGRPVLGALHDRSDGASRLKRRSADAGRRLVPSHPCRARLGNGLPERNEIDLAWGGAPPCEPDRAARLRRREPQELHPLVPNLDVDGDLGHEGHAVTVGHHLHHGGQAGRAQTPLLAPSRLLSAQ